MIKTNVEDIVKAVIESTLRKDIQDREREIRDLRREEDYGEDVYEKVGRNYSSLNSFPVSEEHREALRSAYYSQYDFD